jgi:predicted amidohydrolase YtcJ
MKERTFVNGKIFTGRSEHDFVSAFRVADGKITWVGDARSVNVAQSTDLGGRTVVPGFIDIHTHPTLVAMTFRAVPCTIPIVHDIPGLIEALRTHPNYGKGERNWIEGWGYDESKLQEQRTPTTEDLDRVSTTQPVYVLRSDCHSGVCNTKALQIAGITRNTPDPESARFGRYANGEPNGVLEEFGANDVVMKAKSSADFEARVRALADTAAHYYERGIVAATDMKVYAHPFHDLEVYRAAETLGFGPQILLYFDWSAMRHDPGPDLTDEQRSGRIRFAGIKLFADGSISGRTAWMTEPYQGTHRCGYATMDLDALQSAYEWARRNKVQVAVHAMGDQALGSVVDFFCDQQPWMGRDIPSVRLEHATLLSDDMICKMNDSPMVFGVATQIIFFFAEHDAYVRHLTPRQYRHAYPVRTFYEHLPHVGLSSDAPATTWADPDNVFVSIEAAVRRKAYNGLDIVPEQAISVAQAVLLYTARAAQLGRYADRVGQIAEGCEASFVVLDRDIFTVDADAIHDTRVDETWLAGTKVYQRDVRSNSS